VTSVAYDIVGKAEERRRVLDLIPPPGPRFLAAAKQAMIDAGLDADVIETLDPTSVDENDRVLQHSG